MTAAVGRETGVTNTEGVGLAETDGTGLAETDGIGGEAMVVATGFTVPAINAVGLAEGLGACA